MLLHPMQVHSHLGLENDVGVTTEEEEEEQLENCDVNWTKVDVVVVIPNPY